MAKEAANRARKIARRANATYTDFALICSEVSSMQKTTIEINKKRIALKKRAIVLFNQASRRQALTNLKTLKANYGVVKKSLLGIINA
jgi:hypothetical protein